MAPVALVAVLLQLDGARRATWSPTPREPLFTLHFAIAMLAYALFIVATVHAVVMLAEEKWLHRGVLPPFLKALPPLLEMEALLFRILLAAFVLLTLTVVSGVFFSEQLFGKPLHVHAQDGLRDPLVAHLRRAARRPLPARLARHARPCTGRSRASRCCCSPTSAASSCSRSILQARLRRDVEPIPLSWLFAALAVLLLVSGFFSIAETSMMALNRYRLRHLVREGQRSARAHAGRCSTSTDRLLGVILLGNNLINAASAVLVTQIARAPLRRGRDGRSPIATGAVTFFILVFSEITPKVIGAHLPGGDRAARRRTC